MSWDELFEFAVCDLGVEPDYFWKITFVELNAITKYKYKTLQNQYKADISLAWYIEALARQKKLPKLESLLKEPKIEKNKHSQDDKELIEIAKKKGLHPPE